MSGRSVADIVADLRRVTGTIARTNASWVIERMEEAADLLEHVAADNNRLIGILANTDLEDEITRALGHIPARYLRDGEPWEEGVRRMHEELDELRQFDPQQIIEQERHNRSLVEAELERIDALRPTCPTCDGSGVINARWVHADGHELGDHCPDCTDGRMPWERMAAIVTAVFDETPVLFEADGFDASLAVRSILRSVRP